MARRERSLDAGEVWTREVSISMPAPSPRTLGGRPEAGVVYSEGTDTVTASLSFTDHRRRPVASSLAGPKLIVLAERTHSTPKLVLTRAHGGVTIRGG